jgi:transcriptional regulator with XRE-family HTH domain
MSPAREEGLKELREIRRRRGLSQADLSAMSGVAEFTISEIEAGKRGARPSTLRKLAGALEVPVEALTVPPPSGLEAFFSVHVEALENIEKTVDLLTELAGTAEQRQGLSVEEHERRMGYLEKVVGLLRESSHNATAAAREALRIERGDAPEDATEAEASAKPNPSEEDGLSSLLALTSSEGKHVGTG